MTTETIEGTLTISGDFTLNDKELGKFDADSFYQGVEIGMFYRFWWMLLIMILTFLVGFGLGAGLCY